MSGGSPILSILCVSRLEAEVCDLLSRLYNQSLTVGAEFVLVVDSAGVEYVSVPSPISHLPIAGMVESKGYIESVLDEALTYTHGDYILRIDDDESLSEGLVDWLKQEQYRSHDHWRFPRPHLWQDEYHYLTSPYLYPDYQTRLSVRDKSGGRVGLHALSPYGSGVLAPYPIYHHRFLVRNREQRKEIARKYELIEKGEIGSNFDETFENYLAVSGVNTIDSLRSQSQLCGKEIDK